MKRQKLSAPNLSAPQSSVSASVTVREFARRANCDEKQVRRALAKRQISADRDGLLDPAQLDGEWRRLNRRARPGGRGYGNQSLNLSAREGADNRNLSALDGEVKLSALGDAAEAFVARLDCSGFDQFLADLLAGKFATIAEAERIKANALALKHLLQARAEAKRLFETCGS